MKRYSPLFLRYFILPIFVLTLKVYAAPSDWANNCSIRLSGHVPTTVVADAVFIKTFEADIYIPITFLLPLREKRDIGNTHIKNP